MNHIRKPTILPYIAAGLIGSAATFVVMKTFDPDKATVEKVFSIDDDSSFWDTPHTESKGFSLPFLSSGIKDEAPSSTTGNYLAARQALKSGDLKDAADYYARGVKNTGAKDVESEQSDVMPTAKGNSERVLFLPYALQTSLMTGDIASAINFANKTASRASEDEESVTAPLISMLNIVQAIKAHDYKLALNNIDTIESAGLYGSLKPVLREWMNIAQGKGVPSIIRGLKDKDLDFLSYHLMHQQALMFEGVGMYGDARKFYRRSIRDIETVGYRPVYEYLGHLYDIGEEEAAQLVLERFQRRNTVEQTMVYEPIETIFANLANNPKTLDQKRRANHGTSQLFMSVAELLSREGLHHEALINAYIALYLNDEVPDARMLIAEMLTKQRKVNDAIAMYEQVPAHQTLLHRRSLIKQLYLHSENKDWDETSSIMKTMDRKYPLYRDIYISRGDVYRKMDNFQKAVEFYSKAIESNAKTPLAHNNWVDYYVRGISYERLKEWDAAEKDFMKALELAPDQPQVLNYLAYSWVEREENLEKATDMLLRALNQQPDDPHIMDSVGWAYYVQGKYEDALEYLDSAADILPSNATINEHLGDTLWRLRRRNEARFQWRKALQFEHEEERDAIISDKIENGLTDDVVEPVESEQGEQPS